MPSARKRFGMEEKMKKKIVKFWKEEDGIGVVEIILILLVLVGLVLLFKDEIGKIIDKAFRSITTGADTIMK